MEEAQPRLLAGEYMLGVIAKDEKLYAWGNSYYPPDAYGVDSNIPTIPIQAEELEGILGGDMGQGSIVVILQDRTLQTWVLGLHVCLVAVLIVYWVEKGKNIPTVFISYTCETVVFLAAVKILHLNFPALPLVGLGGTIVLAAGIYKGLEKLFAYVKESWE